MLVMAVLVAMFNVMEVHQLFHVCLDPINFLILILLEDVEGGFKAFESAAHVMDSLGLVVVLVSAFLVPGDEDEEVVVALVRSAESALGQADLLGHQEVTILNRFVQDASEDITDNGNHEVEQNDNVQDRA